MIWSGSATTSSCWPRGRVQLAGDVADLLAVHYRLTGAPGAGLPAGAEVIHADHTGRATSVIVRSTDPVPAREPLDLEDVGLAYLTRAAEATVRGVPTRRHSDDLADLAAVPDAGAGRARRAGRARGLPRLSSATSMRHAYATEDRRLRGPPTAPPPGTTSRRRTARRSR